MKLITGVTGFVCLITLLTLSGFALADVAVGEIGAGGEPGDQTPKICVQHRDVYIGVDANPPGINPFDYRTSLYAFTGEQIEYTIVVRDPNGAEDLGYAYLGVASGVTNFETRILQGADRLVSVQNLDGGWAWYASGGSSTTNTLGVTANGVLRAYQLRGDSTYLNSLEDAYGYAMASVPVYTGTTETTKGVDSCPDITWLIETSEATGHPKYATLAKQRYDNKIAVYGSAQAWAEDIRDARIGQGYPNGIIPWDVDKCVKAAVAMNRYYPGQGYDADAVDMAEVIYDVMYTTPVVFDPDDTSELWYTLGLTGGINAFWSTGMHTTEYMDLKEKLRNYQNPDGSWPSEDGYPVDTQSTAYAVLEAMRTGMISEGIDGAFWLSLHQLLTGGWESPENNEVTGETIDALYSAHGITLPNLQLQPVVICSEMKLRPQETCDGFGKVNLETDKKFVCIYSVEPFRHGEMVIGAIVSDTAGEKYMSLHTENWFLNPAISMKLETSNGMPIHFEPMPYGADTPSERTVHSLNKIKIKNTAEGGVNMWMFVGGTDLYDSSGASACYSERLGTTTNYLSVEEYMWYRGWSGTQWTSWEGWEQISKYDQNQGCGFDPLHECEDYEPPERNYECDIYVDTAGCSGKPVPCYATIQAAIDSASGGETICVYAGTYSGVTVDRPVTLFSLKLSKATIDCGGSGNGVLLKSGGIVLDGFEVTNCDNGVRSYGGPSSYSDITLVNNHIHHNRVNGILLVYDTISNLLVENTIVDDTYGSGNNGIGISNGATINGLIIRGSTVSNSDGHNLFVSGATLNNVLIDHSRIISTVKWQGVNIENSPINGLSLICSEISGSTGIGFTTKGAMTTSNLVVDRSVIAGNAQSGMVLSGTVSGVLIEGSTFGGNGWEDLDLGYWTSPTNTLSNVVIRDNNFNGGPWAGIYISCSSTFTSSDIAINQNNIANGVWNYAGTYVNAENNWWGCMAGPGNPGCSTALNVDFTPWLNAPNLNLAVSCYGAKPVPPSRVTLNPLENVLTNQGTLEMEFKLQYPMPCIGTFDQGNIYVFGKAI